MSQELDYDVATIFNICGNGISDAFADTLEEMCSIFKEVSYQGHVLELDHIEVQLASQNISHEDAIEAVIEVMMTAAEETLKVIGIEVNPDIQPALMNTLLSAFLTFDTTEFPSTILDIVEASEDPIECAVAVLDFITVEEAATWYDVIEHVEVSFVDSLRRVLLDAINRTPPDFLEIDIELNKKRKLVKSVQPDNLLIDYTTESASLDVLLELHSGTLSKLSTEAYIKEVVALASIATNDPGERLEALESITEARIDDPMERLRYNQLMSRTKESLEHVFYRG